MDNMSGKRRATSDLNHDNWDREIEPEKKGSFQTAPEDELKTRVIRKARRKLAGSGGATPSEDADEQPKSVFSGFAGFGKTPSTASTATTATTFSSISTNASANTSDLEKKSDETKPGNIFSFLTKFTPSTQDSKPDAHKIAASDGEVLSTNNNNYNFSKSNTYYAKLKGLNQAVSNWIKTHVDQNPLCLLTPIFKDYEKYLKEIEKNEGTPPKSEASTQSQAMSGFKFSATPVPSTTFSFGISKPDTTDGGPPKSSIFGSSSSKRSDDKSTTTTGFSFGVKSDSATTTATTSSFPASSSTGFSFSGAKPFSFGNIAPPPAAEPSKDKENGDEEDEPPKVEFKAVVEEDSVFSHRCKVFVKSGKDYADRGVGTLYLKPVKDSDKTQLLVRADTNLGNILVNLILNDSIPTQRMGKNNVMLVCIPTPDIEKPTPMLLRVKTSAEADKLLETIDKYKK